MSSPSAAPTAADLVNEVAARFARARLAFGHGTLNARDEAAWLVLHVLKLPLGDFRAHRKRPTTAAERKRILALAERRVRERLPLAYLIHEAWLGNFRFYVDRRVIVPRSFIAELLAGFPDECLAPMLRRTPRTALDLCTGSGCLAVLLAHAFPKARVDACDLSVQALAVAQRNVAAYGLGKRVHLLRSNLFAGLAARRYDLIVSNPPYVDAAAMARLPHEYRLEPKMALAGGSDGLALVRRILAQAWQHLAPGGALVCEIGHHRKALERACPRLPFTWLETSAGAQYVFMLEREQLSQAGAE